MIFKAQPYKLIIEDGKQTHIIDTVNGNGIFKAVKLSKITDKLTNVLGDYQSLIERYNLIESEIKDKLISDLTKEQLEIISDFEKTKKQLHEMYYEYSVECISHPEKHEEILDKIEGKDIGMYFNALKTASLGGIIEILNTSEMKPEEIVKKKKKGKPKSITT